tara:strand:- start:222 stop:530 length:309 start_codon:yes stop_codon:yes gene_type:complete
MRLQPVNDKLVVKVLTDKTQEQKTTSGIILVDNPGEKCVEAEVVAVSEGMYTTTGATVPPICSVGDTVIYDEQAQSPKDFTFEGEDYVIMSQNEILTIIKDK